MRGIVSAAGYIPRARLDRSAITGFVGSGGGRGTRSVASYDEDTTTMGVEAARIALRSAPADVRPDALWFSTVAPSYLDKTNATTVHAALRLDHDVPAFDMVGAVRSAVGALLTALKSTGTTLVVASDLRTGLPGSGDEANGGDAAAAVIVGEGDPGSKSDSVIAELIGTASATEEFVERWRTPGEARSKQWEERFGETKYLPLGDQAWREALKAAGIEAGDVDSLIVSGLHARAVRSLKARLGVAKEAQADDLTATIGNSGAAQPMVLLTRALETTEPGKVIALVVLADGADVLLFRTTDAVSSWQSARTVDTQVAAGKDVPYGKFLSWRGTLTVEPPRRPEPQRVSSSAAGRHEDWKFGFVGGRSPDNGEPQLPPLPNSTGEVPMADVEGTIATFTVDRIAYSPSPPIVFAVVDFDGGGRLPIELTDATVDELSMGDRVEMTFRRLFTSDGIHNYFWKARPVLRSSNG
ncbi:MAG TPA: OB-fold domain-containing protein [Acidimicrobiales bacterium]|jgi:3-hydroxy-3-methylglutaryl CoA synthase|nr:OB-fold domain-containing protein [Acidimicrobiales bacterium]